MKQIPLTQGKFALVDDDDFEWLNQWKWCASFRNGNWYASRRDYTNDPKGKSVDMHTVIVCTQKLVDHRDGDGLNNQRQNLRSATKSQNAINAKLRRDNKTGYRGVGFRNGLWFSRIRRNGKLLWLGTFQAQAEAARAYDAAALSASVEFVRLNFP